MKKIIILLISFLSISVSNADTLSDSFKVAAVEFNPQFMQFENNLPRLVAAAKNAAEKGAKLIVLPELSNSGYLYDSREQINPYLDTIPGKTTSALEPIARQYNAYIAVGISEIDPVTHLAYNSAALIGPHGYIGKYRKNQLNATDTRWATRGNLGYPVFNTPLGKIALVICYDDAYLQSVLMPSLRGANIIAYITSSDRLPLNQPGAEYNHSTIANITSLSSWVGTYVVATTRTDNETNPATGVTTHYDGGASIWDPLGDNLAQAPVSPLAHPTQPITIFATINPVLYKNPAKEILMHRRRPELYQVLSLYRAPIDPAASKKSHEINAAIIQCTPIPGDKKNNLVEIKKLLQKTADDKNINLIVLPENSLIGDGLTPDQLRKDAEEVNGASMKEMSDLAVQYHSVLVFTMPEKLDNKLYETAFILDENGKIIGQYHKSHLNAEDEKWATAGNQIPVFSTPLGRIGIMIGDEVRIPDISSVMAVKRADIVVIPTQWHGQYGGAVKVDPQLLIKPFPKNTMTMWFNIGKYAQAYTIVANYTQGKNHDSGSSGLYSLDPIQGLYPPELATTDQQQAFVVHFKTLGDQNWWMNQNDYIIGRRPELTPPELLSMQSSCFKQWQQNSTSNDFCWNH